LQRLNRILAILSRNAADLLHYHSSAVFLPDGRILIAGGEFDPNVTAEIYSPPYLFDANDNPAVRPVITSVQGTQPDKIAYGTAFDIITPNQDIQSVVLMGTGAATHSFEHNQRFIPLRYIKLTAGAGLRVSPPAHSHAAPPGYYMLFIVNTAETPSFARFVQLT
jgi:hypothetical protein